MKPFSGAIRIQEIYEALTPFKLRYPYRFVKDNNTLEFRTELFHEREKDEYVDEAKEIEIGTNYKLRPVIIISYSEHSNTYLAMAITKVKDANRDYLLAIAKDEIKERHLLFLRKYSGTLKYDSIVLVDAIYLLTDKNIYYCRGPLEDEDYVTIQGKLKKVLFS